MEVAAGPKMFHARKVTAACHTIKKTLPDVIAIANAGRFPIFPMFRRAVRETRSDSRYHSCNAEGSN
jgi:hypothetical protein